MSDDLAYSESTYCEIRREAIRTDEMHVHYVGPDGKTHCDKMVGIGVEPSRADLFKSFAAAIVSGDEEAMRTISEAVEAQQRAAEASKTFSMEVPDGDNGETKTITFPAMKEGQDSWGLPGIDSTYYGKVGAYYEVPDTTYGAQRIDEPYHGAGSVYNMAARTIVYDGIPRTWKCSNHPPGLEVDVPVGEACYCGRTQG
jgi:hypothetical protein